MTQPKAQQDELLSRKEVMQILKMKKDALRERVSDGRLRARRDGNRVVFLRADVQEYIDNLPDA